MCARPPPTRALCRRRGRKLPARAVADGLTDVVTVSCPVESGREILHGTVSVVEREHRHRSCHARSSSDVPMHVLAGQGGGDQGNRTPNPALQMHGVIDVRMECAGRSDAVGGLVGCDVRRRWKLAAIVDAISSTVDSRSGSYLARGAALGSRTSDVRIRELRSPRTWCAAGPSAHVTRFKHSEHRLGWERWTGPVTPFRSQGPSGPGGPRRAWTSTLGYPPRSPALHVRQVCAAPPR
jgi:hypothetical protein